MTEWLSTLLPDSCPANAELAIARFATREAIGRNGFSLSSPAFPQGGELDPCFTADEEDAVAPPMEWTAPPKMAEELVLVVQDASAPDATCHWLVWGLPAQHGKLLARLGLRPLLDLGMRLGEGSGACLAVNVLRAALACHSGMATFAEAGVSEG